METAKYLIEALLDEMQHNIKGGIYNKLQVDFAFNSNHIEGSQLTKEQTRFIFDTQSVAGDNIKVDDIIETVNHFSCFKHILTTFNEPLSDDYIKNLHFILKTGTLSSHSIEAVVGDYKKVPNEVGELTTTKPSKVKESLNELINSYNASPTKSLEDIVKFHSDFEKIHPFYDGNGRIGRLIMLKECLKNDIIPFFINDRDKIFYIKGLYRHQTTGDIRQLHDVCLLMQDDMKSILKYFEIAYEALPIDYSQKIIDVTELAANSTADVTDDVDVDPANPGDDIDKL